MNFKIKNKLTENYKKNYKLKKSIKLKITTTKEEKKINASRTINCMKQQSVIIKDKQF